MTERHVPTIKSPPDIHEDWSTLIARAADDITRIVQSEIRLLESGLRAALAAHISYAIVGFAMVAVVFCGILCALAASILFAHQWMPLWQACGLAALVMFVAAGIIRATLLTAPSKVPATALPASEAVAVERATNSRDVGKQ